MIRNITAASLSLLGLMTLLAACHASTVPIFLGAASFSFVCFFLAHKALPKDA